MSNGRPLPPDVIALELNERSQGKLAADDQLLGKMKVQTSLSCQYQASRGLMQTLPPEQMLRLLVILTLLNPGIFEYFTELKVLQDFLLVGILVSIAVEKQGALLISSFLLSTKTDRQLWTKESHTQILS